MRRIGILLAVCGCAGQGPAGDTGLAAFDPSVVVYADGCEPVPEAAACIEANPPEFLPANAPAISASCMALGYTCCDTSQWISEAAALCIAESQDDFPMLGTGANVTMGCNNEVFGPMYQVYEQNLASGSTTGVGIHAATGRLTWFDDGSGVFS